MGTVIIVGTVGTVGTVEIMGTAAVAVASALAKMNVVAKRVKKRRRHARRLDSTQVRHSRYTDCTKSQMPDRLCSIYNRAPK